MQSNLFFVLIFSPRIAKLYHKLRSKAKHLKKYLQFFKYLRSPHICMIIYNLNLKIDKNF